MGGLRRPPGARHTLGGMSDRTSDRPGRRRAGPRARRGGPHRLPPARPDVARREGRRAAHHRRRPRGGHRRRRRGQRARPRARPRSTAWPSSLQDRLRLDAARVAAVAQALRDIAALPDPVGEVVRGSTLANGLQIRQVRVPMGVVGMIYEARPNVTVDAAGLGLKSRQRRDPARRLRRRRHQPRPGRRAARLAGGQGLPADAVSLLEGGHDAVRALMTARGLVDLLIPRGGADLIQTVVTESTVPVIETGVGNCHVYVDRGRRPRQGARDHRQRQDPPAQRLQRRRVAARAPRRRRRLPAQGARRARRARASRCTPTRMPVPRPTPPASPTTPPPTRTSPPSSTASR